MSDLLSALGEPVRLRMLRVLDGQELTVGELASVVQLPQSSTSRHLKVLDEAKFLFRRTAGPATLYRLVVDDLPPESRALWLTVRAQMSDSAELREDQRRLSRVLASRKTDSQSFFGRIGGEWDQVRSRLFGAEFTSRALLSLLPRGWVVADLGCGTGNAAELLAPHVESVVAVDFSGPMLDAARVRLAGAKNVRFAEGALGTLPLEDASVDAAVCVLVLHHLDDPGEALREMRRVLRRDRGGGAALIVDMVEHGRSEYRSLMGHKRLGFSTQEMTGLLRSAGFGSVRIHLLPADTEAKGPGLFVATGWVGE